MKQSEKSVTFSDVSSIYPKNTQKKGSQKFKHEKSIKSKKQSVKSFKSSKKQEDSDYFADSLDDESSEDISDCASSSDSVQAYNATKNSYFKNISEGGQNNQSGSKNGSHQKKPKNYFSNRMYTELNKKSEYLRNFIHTGENDEFYSDLENKFVVKKKEESHRSKSLKKEAHESVDVKREQSTSYQSSLPSLIKRKRAKSNQNPNILTVIHNNELMLKVRQVILLEDLKLIDAMSRKDEFGFHDVGKGFGPNFWINVVNAGFIDRALESTRDRVKRFIRNIGDKDVESIVHWVNKHNTVDGFLYFVGSKKKIRGDRFFSHVSKEDPLTTKKKKFSRRTDLLASESEEEDDIVKKEDLDSAANFQPPSDKTGKKDILNTKKEENDANIQENQMFDIDDIDLKSEYSSDIISGGSIEILYWKEKDSNLNDQQVKNEHSSQEIKQEMSDSNSNLDTAPIIDMDVINQKNFEQNRILTLCEKYNIRPKELSQILHQLNKKYKDLDIYMQDREKNEFMLWTNEEDEVLKTCRNQFDSKFMKLRKYKGDGRISDRLDYLGINLPFLG